MINVKTVNKIAIVNGLGRTRLKISIAFFDCFSDFFMGMISKYKREMKVMKKLEVFKMIGEEKRVISLEIIYSERTKCCVKLLS